MSNPLSNDVLSEIFLHCLPQADHITASHFPRLVFLTPNVKTAPVLLCRVCVRWRVLAMATPRLWTSLDTRAVPNVKLITRWLHCSGQSPLSLSLSPDLQGHREQLLLASFYLRRCRSSEIQAGFIPVALQPPLPETTHLDVAVVSIDRLDTVAGEWYSALLMRSPHLTNLHWSRPAIVAPWSQLRYLSFCTFHSSDLESILPRLINLMELHLVDVSHGAWVPPGAPYLLPTITTLSLQHQCEQLLQLLTLPHLEHLVLAKVWLSVHAQNLHEFLDRSGCKLKSLELQGWGIDTLHDYYRHPAIHRSLNRLAVSSEALTRFFDMLEAECPGTLLPQLHLFLRPIDICFQIEGLHGADHDERWDGMLASLLLSSFPSLAVLKLNLGVFSEGELESRLVSTPKGQLQVRRPTCQHKEYEQWWGSEEGQEFRHLRRSENRDALDKFWIDWAVVDGSLPRSGSIGLYSSAPDDVDGFEERLKHDVADVFADNHAALKFSALRDKDFVRALKEHYHINDTDRDGPYGFAMDVHMRVAGLAQPGCNRLLPASDICGR